MRLKLALFCLMLVSSQAFAHPKPKSLVELRIHETLWVLDLQLPASGLEVAMRYASEMASNDNGIQSIDKNGIDKLELTPLAVQNYIEPRIRVYSADIPTELWPVASVKAEAPASDSEPFWDVRVELTPISDAQADKVIIDYQVIGQEIVTHESIVVLAQDDVMPSDNKLPIVLDNLRAQRKTVTIDR